MQRAIFPPSRPGAEPRHHLERPRSYQITRLQHLLHCAPLHQSTLPPSIHSWWAPRSLITTARALHAPFFQHVLAARANAGTTTATVLTRAILVEGCKSVAAGMNPMDLRRGINLAVDHVVGELKQRAKMISTTEEIAQVPASGGRGRQRGCKL